MEKFLSIPVTSEQNQLVQASGIILIEQASTLTHATAGAGDETQRDAIQNAVVAALQTSWTNVAYTVSGLPYAVSGITVA